MDDIDLQREGGDKAGREAHREEKKKMFQLLSSSASLTSSLLFSTLLCSTLLCSSRWEDSSFYWDVFCRTSLLPTVLNLTKNLSTTLSPTTKLLLSSRFPFLSFPFTVSFKGFFSILFFFSFFFFFFLLLLFLTGFSARY